MGDNSTDNLDLCHPMTNRGSVRQRLRLGFEPHSFADAVSQEIATPGVTPVAAAGRFVSDQFATCLMDTMGIKLIRPPTIRINPYGKGGYSTLSQLARDGHELWYTEAWFSTKHADAISEISVDPFGYVLKEMDFGFGVTRGHQLKTRPLKTQVNHELRLNHILLPPALWDETISAVNRGVALTQPYIANPLPGMDSGGADSPMPGYRTVSFDHIVDGRRAFCDCARTAHDRMRASASAVSNDYQSGSWPHRVLRLLDQANYQEDICHLCIARVSGPEAAALRYGDTLQDFEEAYIDQFTVGHGMDTRTARAEVQQQLGLSRWKSEALMFTIVKALFNNHIVQREASPLWLGRQRLDVFVPEIKLAIEYQGAQHFQAVDLFGGDHGFRRAVERDALKKRLCEQNGVTLVYVLHSDPLTPAFIKRRLQRFIS